MRLRTLFSFIAVRLVSVFGSIESLPNIVVILTDDQGYADISFNPEHSEEVSTPHMDALAKEGIFFTQAYTSGAVCSPTRAGLMLGQYQQRVGIYTAGDGGRGFDPKMPIFPGMLPDAYTSMAIGKWHLGLDNDYPELKWHAMSRGFDEAYKFMGRGGHDYFDSKGVNSDDYAPIYRNKTRIPRDEHEGYLTTRLSEEAVAFIDRQKKSPFFLYLAYNAVHTPAQAPEEDIAYYRKKFPELSERRISLMAMLDHLDKGVGAVVNKLKEENVWDNTLLFFLTDNGGAKAMEADNGSLRDYKQSLYEGGIRTPWIVSWSAKYTGGRKIDTPIISLDILPTVLDAIHGSEFNQAPFDGKSLLPLMHSNDAAHHPVLYWDSGDDKDEWAVRKGDWKLHSKKGKTSLFNLVDDESETTDLSKRNAEIVRELSGLYETWLAEMVRSEKFLGR